MNGELVRWGRILMLGALAPVIAGGCAEAIGKRAASGAVEELRKQSAEGPPSGKAASLVAAQAIEGAVAALDDPEQREKIRSVVAAAVDEAVANAFRTATAPGPDGRSQVEVLAAQLAGAATDDAMAKVNAELALALQQLFPGCAGPDAAACRQRPVQELSRAAATSFSAGVRDSLGWPLVIGAAVLGLLLGLLGHWLWTTTRPRGGTRLVLPRVAHAHQGER